MYRQLNNNQGVIERIATDYSSDCIIKRRKIIFKIQACQLERLMVKRRLNGASMVLVHG